MSPTISPPPIKKRKKVSFAPLGWLSEKPETRSVQIAVIATIIIHLLILGSAPYLFQSEVPTHAKDKRPRSFRIRMIPPPPKPKAPPQRVIPKYVETNPNAPKNKPDKTNNVSNRDQQTAQEKPSKVTDTDMPAMEGKKDFKNDQLVDGRLTKPAENTPPEPQNQATPTPPSLAVPKAQQDPLTGFQKNMGSSLTGFGTNISKPTTDAKPIPQKVDGAKDMPVVDGPQITTPKVDAHHPRARPTLSIHSRPAILAENTMGSRNIGVVGRDARWSNYGDYINKLAETVQIEWDNILSSEMSRPPPGSTVRIDFILGSDGSIKKIVHTETSAGTTEQGFRACQSGLTNPSPFGKWTDDMIAIFGSEQELTFTFYYE